jgi:transcriptional regulator
MSTAHAQILPGTLEILILRAVSLGPLHGYGILRRIEQLSAGALAIEEGALYPALWRLEKEGLVDGEGGTSDNNRRAKFYSITRQGRLSSRQVAAWERLVAAMGPRPRQDGGGSMSRGGMSRGGAMGPSRRWPRGHRAIGRDR